MELKQLPQIARLLFQRLTDTLSVEEEAEFENWLSADDRNLQMWKEISRKNFYSEKELQSHLFNALAAFCRVQAKYHRRLFQRRLQRICVGVAAIAVVTLGIIWIKINFARQADKPLPVFSQFPAGESRAVLILGDGQRMELNRQMDDSVIIDAGIRLETTGGKVEYRQEKIQPVTLTFNTLEIPRKGEFQLVLGDGTKVWLNSESCIRYPVAFTGKERRVYLQGEAYFEVSKNKEIPFIVDMGKVAVQVLGTAFNARAYRDETRVYATLAEGKIQLEAGQRNLILQPEEQGVVELASGELTRKKVDVRLYTGWKEGRFIFQEQTLEEMMNTLSRWYDIQVFYENPAVRKVTFSGNLKRYDSFDKIIGMLEMTGMAHFKVKGNTIIISE